MAVSAFKTSSKKGNLSNNPSSSCNWPKKTPSRRSKSVSASTRIYTDIPSDFVHTWINPLFCSADSAPGTEITPENGFQIAKNDPICSEAGSTVSDENFNATRGRSMARNIEGTSTASTSRKEVVRSLSRVSTRRQSRSISRNPESRLQCRIYEWSGGSGNRNNPSHENKGKSKLVAGEHMHNISTAIDLCSSQEFSFSDGSTTPSLEDMVSFSYLSDTEEKRITEVFEQAKLICDDFLNREDDGCGFHEVTSLEAIKTSTTSSPAISVATLTHTKAELKNPEAIELVLDIRREYAEKYEESQERIRKLKADLALEEQRVQRLGRIIKETTHQKSASIQKSRSRRKRSMERKRLSQEAMAYFDETVSLSLNFDTSDFSTSDDPSSLNNTPSSAPTTAPATLTSTLPLRLRDAGLLQGAVRVSERRECVHEDVTKLERRDTKFVGDEYDRILQLLDSPSHEELVVDNVVLRTRLNSGSLILCPL